MSSRAADGRARRSSESHAPSAERSNRRMSSGRETVETFVSCSWSSSFSGSRRRGFVIPTASMAPTLMGRHKR